MMLSTEQTIDVGLIQNASRISVSLDLTGKTRISLPVWKKEKQATNQHAFHEFQSWGCRIREMRGCFEVPAELWRKFAGVNPSRIV